MYGKCKLILHFVSIQTVTADKDFDAEGEYRIIAVMTQHRSDGKYASAGQYVLRDMKIGVILRRCGKDNEQKSTA